MGPYSIRPNPNGFGWDVVRSTPITITADLKQTEAEALAFALNAQVRILEGNKK